MSEPKSYGLYCIGSPLVDVRCSCDHQLIQHLQLEYGARIEATEETQSKMLSFLKKSDFGVQEFAGGAAANTAFAFAQLGGKVFFAGQVGQDRLGRIILDSFNKVGVNYNADLIQKSKKLSGSCICFITPDHNRTMSTYLGANNDFGIEKLDLDALKSSAYLFIEGYLLDSSKNFAIVKTALEYCKENNVKIALGLADPSVPRHFMGSLQKILEKKVDLLICNEEEVESLKQHYQNSQIVNRLLSYTSELIITRGPRGAEYYTSQTSIPVPAPSISPVDTTGAGDSFAGSFLFYRQQYPADIQNALSLACQYASQVVTVQGPRLMSSL